MSQIYALSSLDKQLMKAYDLLPDVLFWVKNMQGQVVHANSSFIEHVGAHGLEQVIGKNDFDFSPSHLAKQFVEDDKRVLRGELVSDRLEMNLDSKQQLAWFTTSKRPWYNGRGEVVGSYGISRHLEKTSIAQSGVEALREPVEYIRAHFARDISLQELAAHAHLSISALERRFTKYLSRTPLQYLTDVRLENARRLLVETNLTIADVAFDSGFKDASYFSRRFKRKFSMLPREFRLAHKLNQD